MKSLINKCIPYIPVFLKRFFLKENLYFGISLKITGKCNLNCIYCSACDNSTDIDCINIIEFLRIMKNKGLFYVILSGGEPFFYSERDILIDYLKENNFYTVINTNGILINNLDYRDFLLKADEVVVSIDGDNVINDKSRGKGSFQKIIKTLGFLKNNKIKTVISTVVWKENCNEKTLEFFRKLKNKFKVTLDFEIISSELVPEHNKKNCIPETQDIGLFSETLSYYKKKFKWNEISDISIKNLKECRPIICKSFNYVLYMNNDGKLYPCVDKIGKKDFYLGDINTFRGAGKRSIYCNGCKCNSLLNFNTILSGKLDLNSLIRWVK
ncbi:MAG: radical SAM protein [Candidatus Muirbacterium halophilum]|nr:radical SAM protein [Candidatus Muirbacterium halophilum]MCK9477366.1 radical SAM protein [Candidatus Muirbacterium halophilum]